MKTRLQLQRDMIDAARRKRLRLHQRGETQPYCRGTTQQGEPCRWRARASGFCRWHERQQVAA